MSRRRTVIFLSGLMAALAVLCYLIAAPFITPAAFAVLLAVGFQPLYRRLDRWMGRPGLAAATATLVIAVALLVPLAFVVSTVAGEMHSTLADAQSEGGLVDYGINRFREAADWISERYPIDPEELTGNIATQREEAAGWLGRGVAQGIWAAGGWLVDAGLSGLILFFLLRDGDRIRSAIVDLAPLEYSDSQYLLEIIGNTLRANLHGVVGVALLQGFLTGVGFVIAGVPSPFTWSVVAGFFAMLPIVGAFVVWGPAAAWLAASESYGWAIFLVLWGTFVTGLADNIVRPVFVGERTHQHPMLVFLSILGGVGAFGAAGLFLGPLVISVAIAVFKVLRRKIAGNSARGEVAAPRHAWAGRGTFD